MLNNVDKNKEEIIFPDNFFCVYKKFMWEIMDCYINNILPSEIFRTPFLNRLEMAAKSVKFTGFRLTSKNPNVYVGNLSYKLYE